MKESGEGRERENIDMTGRGERGNLINCLNKFKIVLQKLIKYWQVHLSLTLSLYFKKFGARSL